VEKRTGGGLQGGMLLYDAETAGERLLCPREKTDEEKGL
jgi:hypothetical protein